MDRRSFLRLGLLGAGAAAAGPRLLDTVLPGAWAAAGPYGSLQAADANGIQLPPGFSARVVGRSGQTIPGTSYVWHAAPDGGACFPVADGGWTYASNSEIGSGGGGVGVLRFRSDGSVAGAYRILSGTKRQLRRRPDAVGHVVVVRRSPPARCGSATLWVSARRWPGRPWAGSGTRRPPSTRPAAVCT